MSAEDSVHGLCHSLETAAREGDPFREDQIRADILGHVRSLEAENERLREKAEWALEELSLTGNADWVGHVCEAERYLRQALDSEEDR